MRFVLVVRKARLRKIRSLSLPDVFRDTLQRLEE
jgi:hypothetical protein